MIFKSQYFIGVIKSTVSFSRLAFLISPQRKIDRIPRRQPVSFRLRYLGTSLDLNTVVSRLLRIARHPRPYASE